MENSKAIEVLENFRVNPWEFQFTFETPLKSLELFVKTILGAVEPPNAASVAIDLVVFEPRNWIEMLGRHSISPSYERGLCVTAKGKLEIEELLRVTLSDWIDFLFMPEPPSFAIYADHDEFTTFYAHTHSILDRMKTALKNQGFKAEENFQRQF